MRIGLSHEILTQFDEARRAYRQSYRESVQADLRDLALIGLARVLMAEGEHSEAESQLLHLWLTRQAEFSDEARAQTEFLLAELQSVSALGQIPESGAETFDLNALPRPFIGLEQLRGLSQSTTPTEISMVSGTQRLSEATDPQVISVSAHYAQTPLYNVLSDIAQEVGLTLYVSDSASRRMRVVNATVNVNDAGVVMLLHALLRYAQIDWSLNESDLSLGESAEDGKRSDSAAMAVRMLSASIIRRPDHLWSPRLQLVLAELLSQSGRPDESRNELRRLITQNARTIWSGPAALQLAAYDLKEGDRRSAIQSLYQCVDSSAENQIKVTAYVKLGRLLLEDNNAAAAVAALMRAESLGQGTEHEAAAVLWLAVAHLVNGHPTNGNTVLVRHRHLMADKQYSDRRAFVSALARVQSAETEDRHQRELQSLVTAIPHVRLTEEDDTIWVWLLSTAYKEVGLAGEASQYSLQQFELRPDSPMTLRLATQALTLSEGYSNTDLPFVKIEDVVAQEGDARHWDIQLLRAQLAQRSGDHDRAMADCRQLINECHDNEVQRQALQVMGSIYSKRQNREAAILCFSGYLPDPVHDTKIMP